jgi:NOL1/NOP2/sun family putative RNA methylase
MDGIQALDGIAGFDFALYEKSILEPIKKTVRVNTLKAEVDEVCQSLESIGWNLEKIPYFDYAFWMDGISPGNSLEYVLGLICIQDPGSMLIPELMDLKKEIRVLDLCAAPGSKTTQISQIMKGSGTIIANDASSERIKGLAMNIQRCGCSNCLVSHTDGRNLPNWGKEKFDCVLVDSPCSGLGQRGLKRERGGSEKYSPLQRELISAGFECLKPGGVMIYSTCTFWPEENEDVVNSLLESSLNAYIVDVFKEIRGKGLDCVNSLVDGCARIYPWHNRTDGFFIAKIRKDERD